MTLYIILGVIALIVLYIVFVYNSLIRYRNRTQEAWSDIDAQLKRRYELIPNLVSTVKGSANFETSTLEKVIAARSGAMGAATMSDHTKSEGELGTALRGFFGLAESYPDLKSNQNFLSLQNELADTENKLQAARRFYNANVLDYNTALQVFPTVLFAKILSFSPAELFKLDEDEEMAARKPVEVKF